MSRTLPYICPHNKVLDWGDFGPDNGGAEECEVCCPRPAVRQWVGPWRLNRTTGQWRRMKSVPYAGMIMGHDGRVAARMAVTYYGPVVPR